MRDPGLVVSQPLRLQVTDLFHNASKAVFSTKLILVTIPLGPYPCVKNYE